MNPYLGAIFMMGCNFAPNGFQLCYGQTLPIQQNTALFSLLGTYYGGNGTSTFALPDLQGRVPMHFGNGTGLTPRVIGEKSGTENTTLLASNLPAHNHTFNAINAVGTSAAPTNNYLANTGTLDPEYKTSGTVVQMNATSIGVSGGSTPINNIQPSLAINFCIATSGIFPSRN